MWDMKIKILLSLVVAVSVILYLVLYSSVNTSLVNQAEPETLTNSQYTITSAIQQPSLNLTVTVSTTERMIWTVTPRTRKVIEALEPSVEEVIIKLLNCSDVAYVTHIATFTERDINYTILNIAEPGSNVATTYYITWCSVGEFRLLDYGKVKFEVVTESDSGWITKLNTTDIRVGGAPSRLEVLERGGYKVMRLVNVPDVLRRIYVVIVYDVEVIKLNSEVVANATAAGRFYIDYENAVLWVDDLSSEWHDLSKAEVLELKHVASVKPGPISKGETGGVCTYVKYELVAQYVNGLKVTRELTPNVLVMPWLVISVGTPPIIAVQIKP